MQTENIRAITDFLFIENDIKDLKTSDLVIILSNNNIKGITTLFDELFKKGIINQHSQIIISGDRGPLDTFKEKECDYIAKVLCEEFGYNMDMFTLEDKATNIYDNLLYSKALLQNINAYQHILVIGAAFALRRVKLCASRLDYPIAKMQYVGIVDPDGRNIGKDTWWKSDEAKKRVYEELERIGKYLVKGDLDIK